MARIQYWSELLAQIEIWPVVLAIAISFAWPRYLPAAVMTAAFFWFVRIIAYHRLSVRTPVDWAIVLLLIMMGTSFSITLFREKTTVQLLRVLTGIALFYAIANWCNSLLRLRLLILGIVLAGLGLALTAPISVKWHTKLPFVPFDLYQRFTLLVSDTVHPNVMAGSLVILYPIGLCWALFSWNDLNFWERSISILGNVIMLGVLILTQSRGAWIALGVVILIMPLLRWRWGWIVLVLGAGALVLVVNFIGFSSAWDLVVRSDAIGGTGDRLEIWARTIYMIRDFPYTGIGMGAYPEVFNGLYPLISPDSVFMDHAHNLILQIAADLGIPGLIAWIGVLLGVIWVSWQVYWYGRSKGDRTAFGVGAGLLCSQLALMVHGMLDAVTWGMVKPAPIVWGVWGVAIAAWYVIVSKDLSF